MKRFLLLIAAFLFTSLSLAQDLPHEMTESEKILWEYYQPQIFPEFTDPPPTPVRTMAEWEELQGVIITWTQFTSILRQVVDYAQDEGLVYIVCSDSNGVKNYLTSGGVPLLNLKFLVTSFNSIWVRDYGPWSVYSSISDSLKIIDWIYNRPRPLDDVIPVFFANYSNLPIYQTTTPPYDFVATGGNFFNDGHGTGFSSKLILNENPGKTEAQIDTIMKKFMGLNRYIKMENLPYDGIHHIDMHMKLLDEETLLVGQYPPGVADGPQIEANLQYILNNFLTCYGRPFKVVRILMPPDQSGQYPNTGGDYRTYTNSIIINKAVIIPTYQLQYDTTAFRIYREAMPGYRIVGVNSNSIIPSLGAIHCIVKEVGVTEPVYISHPKLSGEIAASDPVEIKAFIKSRTGIANASVYWTADTTLGFTALPMSIASGDTFTANIPSQPSGAKVYYYISASSNSGRSITKPITAPAGFYNFEFDDPVPVELISFSASAERNDIVLNWITASEMNNSGFEIERSVGSRQSAVGNIWEKISFVKGNGTTTEFQNYQFIDKNLSTGKYSYSLKQIDFDGSFEYLPSGQAGSNVIEVEVGTPGEFSLSQNYPNPFNPSTSIQYAVSSPANGTGRQFVSLKVYDILGREVTTLVNEQKQPGVYEAEFSAGGLASGIYYYKLQAENFIQTRKMILIK
ncbi:MAG: agmatine deiminase family protein [Ignavibacteria bacterium]|nr:agmatine deiminase family protein [Ignavibacteria bacterium]